MKCLLEECRAEDIKIYFSTPNYEMKIDKFTDIISFEKALEIPQIISDIKDKLQGKLVFGAIPFDINESGKLYITDSWETNSVPFKERANVDTAVTDNNYPIKKEYIPSCEHYMEMVEKGVECITKGKLSKLVLSRGVKFQFPQNIDVTPILQCLYSHNPAGYTYFLKKESGKYVVGASPEMLVSKRGNYVYSNPLAGSRQRGKNQEEDLKFSKELNNSSKDLIEHNFVVEDIVRKLSHICKTVSFSEKPELLSTEQLWHLSTKIEGELINSNSTVFDAALSVHPTPAICGVPQSNAYEKIRELEGSSRGIFTGIIGWCDENGDGDWAIAIRGAEIDKDSIFIRAGAGIVQKSVAQEELEETEIKFRTMLRGLNLGEI